MNLSSKIPSGYLTVCHGIDGPFIDGLPIENVFSMAMLNIQMVFVYRSVLTQWLTGQTGKNNTCFTLWLVDILMEHDWFMDDLQMIYLLYKYSDKMIHASYIRL